MGINVASRDAMSRLATYLSEVFEAFGLVGLHMCAAGRRVTDMEHLKLYSVGKEMWPHYRTYEDSFLLRDKRRM